MWRKRGISKSQKIHVMEPCRTTKTIGVNERASESMTTVCAPMLCGCHTVDPLKKATRRKDAAPIHSQSVCSFALPLALHVAELMSHQVSNNCFTRWAVILSRLNIWSGLLGRQTQQVSGVSSSREALTKQQNSGASGNRAILRSCTGHD